MVLITNKNTEKKTLYEAFEETLISELTWERLSLDEADREFLQLCGEFEEFN